jgi:hypothetical protein
MTTPTVTYQSGPSCHLPAAPTPPAGEREPRRALGATSSAERVTDARDNYAKVASS